MLRKLFYDGRRLVWRALHGGAPMAKILTPSYFGRRDILIGAVLKRISKGEKLDEVYKNIDALSFDERLIEYGFLAHWFQGILNKTDILDVGCTLNNKVVSDMLSQNFQKITFCNPAKEPIKIDLPTDYHVSNLDNAFPKGEEFSVITCLSTLEHIGFDNSQYGSSKNAEYTEPNNTPFLKGLCALAGLLKEKGQLLISVPYGYQEGLVHPHTLKVGSQVFDHQAILEGMDVLKQNGVVAELKVFEAGKMGWFEHLHPDNCTARYADGCPAAKAVAFLSCRKI